MKYKQYSVVKIVKIKKQICKEDLLVGSEVPRVGDLAAIIEVYEQSTLGYELECESEDGTTNWMLTFSPEEVELELISEHT